MVLLRNAANLFLVQLTIHLLLLQTVAALQRPSELMQTILSMMIKNLPPDEIGSMMGYMRQVCTNHCYNTSRYYTASTQSILCLFVELCICYTAPVCMQHVLHRANHYCLHMHTLVSVQCSCLHAYYCTSAACQHECTGCALRQIRTLHGTAL
jgi:hypothetical protein